MKDIIGVLGTGTMGKSIGLLCLKSEKKVLVFSRSKASSDSFTKYIKENLDSKDLSLLDSLDFCYDLENLKNVNFIIEALIEDLDFKKDLFKKLDKIIPSGVVLSSSTSALLPTEICVDMVNKNRFIVAHFWNPAHIVPLVEIVPSIFTDEITIEKTKKLLDELNRKSITMKKECPGFIGNRIQLAVLREATKIFSEGFASAKDIDDAIKYSLGLRYAVTGPLESCDLGGIDIFNNVSKYLFKELSNEVEGSKVLEEYVNANKLGAKTGEGFYSWNDERIKEATQKRLDIIDYLSNK